MTLDVAAGADPAPISSIQSSVVWRAITLLELLSHEETVGVREAARSTGIDRSAVSRLLAQLEQLECVEQIGPRGVYTVGPRLFSMAAALRARDSLWRAAEPILADLVAAHDETCYLTVRSGHGVVFRDKVDCAHTIRYVVELGTEFPLTTGAAGTAILSGLPPEDVEEVLAEGLRTYTSASFTDPDSYRRQLAADRIAGYSVSMGRWVRNGAGVAAPFFDASGTCRGALTLSCPADRLEAHLVPGIGESVRAASRELSRRLGYVERAGDESSLDAMAGLER